MFPHLGSIFAPPGATAEGIRQFPDQMRAQILAAPPGATMFEQAISTMVRDEANRSMLSATRARKSPQHVGKRIS
jgi:hypothetical protein